MDFFVVLERPGFRVARRRARTARVGVQHKVTKEDSIKWWVHAAHAANTGEFAGHLPTVSVSDGSLQPNEGQAGAAFLDEKSGCSLCL